MNDQGEEREAPVLTDEGAALLARAVARHKKSSSSHDRRHDKDVLRNDPASAESAFEADDAEDLAVEDPAEDVLDADDAEELDVEELAEDNQLEDTARAESEIDPDPADGPDPEPKKPVRSRPINITTSDHKASLQPVAKNETPTSRTLVALAFMMLAGLFLIGFAAWSTFSDDVVESEVAGVVEENEDPPAEQVDDPPVASDSESPVVEDSVGAEASSEEPVDIEPPEPAPAAVDPEALSFTLGEGVGLSVYDVDPVNQGTRSFAIRISNAGDELIPATAGFEIQVLAASGERIPAMVRFVHQEIPSGSSAIATVRVEGVPQGPTTAVLVFAGNDVDEQELP